MNQQQHQPVNVGAGLLEVPKLWIGGDPGKTGGLVALSDYGHVVGSLLMPIVGQGTKARWRVDCRALRDWLRHDLPRGHDVTVAIERVSAMPDDGPVQAFRFGRATAALFAFAEILDMRLVEISPKDWQAMFLRGYPRGTRADIKASAALVASDRWPSLAPHLRLKKNWGLADAALIADCARLVEHARGTTTTPPS